MTPPSDKSQEASQGDEKARWLSAAADGDAQAIERACNAWRDDAEVRATWHNYHLIGDVLRSEALATAPERDAAFLQGLRQKLAAEPRVLAPMPLSVSKARRPASAWLMPAAAAAGFVLVAGVLVVSRLSDPAAVGSAEKMAVATQPASIDQPARAATVARAALPANSTLIRDARLDEYLRAHYAARGAIAVPGSALRRVEADLSSDATR